MLYPSNLRDTAEINSFLANGVYNFMEAGKRLKHAKEELLHGEFGKWLESVDINKRTAQSMIQAYEQFKNTQTSTLLSTGKIFEMLSLPKEVDRQDFLNKQHTIPSSGEQKTVDEMTVRELREVKKALKQAEEDNKFWQLEIQPRKKTLQLFRVLIFNQYK